MTVAADTNTDRKPWRAAGRVPQVFVFVIIALAAAWTIRQEFALQRAREASRLESISELRATQVADWVARQVLIGSFLESSTVLSSRYLAWQDKGDLDAQQELLKRAGDAQQAAGADNVLIVDATGRVLACRHPPDCELEDDSVATLTAAIDRGKSMHSSIYRSSTGAHSMRMDVVIPLLPTGKPARGAIVLSIDPGRTLYPVITAWPVPSETAESVLWDKVGPNLVNISDVHRTRDSAGQIDQPLASSTLPVARVMRGDMPADKMMHGVDFWGVDIFAVGRPVPGTRWWLVSKVDMQEVDAPAWTAAWWTLGAALLAMLGTALSGKLWRQRRVLNRQQEEHVMQNERLQALGLLEAIAKSASDPIFAKDLEGRYVFCNRAAGETVGLAPADVLGLTNADLFDPETAARITAHDIEAMSGKFPVVFEEMIPRPGGNLSVLTTKGPLFDTHGKLIGMLGVARDITEIRRAESALRTSETHYRTVVSVLNEGVFVCDPQGKVLSWNRAAEQLLGRSIEDWQGRLITESGWTPVNADGTPMALADMPIGKVLAGRPAQHNTLVRVVNPSGQMLVMEVSSVPVFGPDSSELVSVVTSFSDVTASRQLQTDLLTHRDELEALVRERTGALQGANDALESAARFNRNIADSIPGRVAYWDADMRFRFANRAYAHWFGKQPDELVGRTLAEVFGEAYMAPLVPRLKGVLAGEPQFFQLERQQLDGSVYVHQVHYVPERAGGGKVSGVYVMAFDVTAMKRTEEELKRTNDELAHSRDLAEIAMRAKSAFVANMSHEIRTPMNGILGLTHLLARDPRDDLQRERLAKIGDAGQHLLQVINDILDLSKIEAGKLTLEETDFSLDTLLSTAVSMVGDRARSKGLDLVLDIEAVPKRLRGDPTRLSQIILNLLSNAVKFTEAGWVRLRGEVVAEERSRMQLRFEVQDTGEGIDPSQQETLFHAFEQGDNTTTRRHGGTGLGLSLTRKLVLAMGGDVGLRSELGTGSTFWFTAWLMRSMQAGERAMPISTQSMRALLVDDSPDTLAELGGWLESMGMQVDALADGESALRKLEEKMASGSPYDVLLIDWQLKGDVDGIETLERMSQLLGDGIPPSIIMSDAASALLGKRSRSVRFDSVLVKPISETALHDSVSQVLRQQRTPPPAPAEAVAPKDSVEQQVRARHAGQRVLLAEDNMVNMEVSQELLNAVGLVVETADNGASAMELALSRPYDLILMDVQMPTMDGLEATRAIRARSGDAIPIVAMTANAFAEDRLACLDSGMNDHVAKPVDPAVLYATLLRWMPIRKAPAPKAAADGKRAIVATPAEMEVKGRLGAIAGFDVDLGLRNTGNRMSTLVRMLKRFVDIYRGGEPVLLGPASADQRDAWQAAAHSLRGACATIGATLLAELAQGIDTDLTDEVEPELLAEDGAHLSSALGAFVADIGDAIAAA